MAIRDKIKLLNDVNILELFKETLPSPSRMQLRNNWRVTRLASAMINYSLGSARVSGKSVDFNLHDRKDGDVGGRPAH